MRQASNEALPCAKQLAARKHALTIDQAENLQDVLTALQYCIENPWDIAALAICAGCLRQSASIYRAFADTLLVNQGLTFGYEMQRPRRTSAIDGYTKAKPADDAVTLIIGVNHTGSLSLVDALKDCLGAPEVLELEAYSTVSDGAAMPRLCDEIESLSATFRRLGKLPRVLYSHRPIPMHLCLPEGTPYRYVTMLRNPVSRLVALYYWLVKHRHTSFHWMHPIVKQGGSLDDYLAHFHQSGARPGGFAPAEYFHRSWVELGLVPDDCRDDPVKAASHVLDRHFSVVGITELFDETLFVLYRTMGLGTLPRWRLLGNSDRPNLHELPPATIRMIDELSGEDTALYASFRKRFELRHADDIREFRDNIGSLRIIDDRPSTAPIFNPEPDTQPDGVIST